MFLCLVFKSRIEVFIDMMSFALVKHQIKFIGLAGFQFLGIHALTAFSK